MGFPFKKGLTLTIFDIFELKVSFKYVFTLNCEFVAF